MHSATFSCKWIFHTRLYKQTTMPLQFSGADSQSNVHLVSHQTSHLHTTPFLGKKEASSFTTISLAFLDRFS